MLGVAHFIIVADKFDVFVCFFKWLSEREKVLVGHGRVASMRRHVPRSGPSVQPACQAPARSSDTGSACTASWR